MRLRDCLLLTLLFPFSVNASLTLYTTSWSMYGKNPYEYDGAYKSGQPYGKLTYVQNPNMVKQFNKADVVVWSFLQVWNPKDPNQAVHQIPASWDGVVHFADLWSELPLEGQWVIPQPPETKTFLQFCAANVGACSAIHMIGEENKKQLFHYLDRKGIGQLNSFGAFIHSEKIKAKRIISFGGANTVENKGVSTYTFKAIFRNQEKFLQQYKRWMTHFKNLKGINYDFEPPINIKTGEQLPVNHKTAEDYRNLYELVKASRHTLGEDAYISVTITANRAYLQTINTSVKGGWFQKISMHANAINIMTYDLHGPWQKKDDPYTSLHALLKQPQTNRLNEFGVQYATNDIANQVISYGMPKDKLQIGIAAYGRGYAGVNIGGNTKRPGYEQRWTKSSTFDKTYAEQDGLIPYKSIYKIVTNLGYESFQIKVKMNRKFVVSGAYLYSKSAKQFISYQSPEAVKSICKFVKLKQIKGVILWSANNDLPISNPKSLIASYRSGC